MEGGGEPHDPPKTPWGQGKGREGEVRLHRGHSDVHEGVARRVRRPVGGHASAPLSSSSSVVLVGRLLRPSPCSQVRWKCLGVVPCQHKLIGWKEAAMGGRRVAGGRDGGGWALAEERRSSPKAHPSLPPSLHPRKIWQWSYVTDGSINPWWKGTWWKQPGSAPGPQGPQWPGGSSASAWAPSSGYNPY